MLDIPNERSSHSDATPHGGGIAIITALFAGIFYGYVQDRIDERLFFALLSTLPVFVVSLVDDLFPLSAKFRFSVQLLSAMGTLYALGGVNTINFGLISFEGVWVNLFGLLLLLWMTNLYNFLDGIDGYAGSEAVFVGLTSYGLFGSEVGLLIAVASAGFLIFNWDKASIFMGDVGSASLGFIFAILMLYDASSTNFSGWLVLLSLFWFDATLTLYRRFRQGDKLSQAHKKHIFQRLNQVGFSHQKVVLLGMGINAVLFSALWIAGSSYYWLVLFLAVLLLYFVLKYVDSKKAFV